MGKLRLDINSTAVLGTYGIVDIIFNGTNLAASKQLSATVESLEYDVDILPSSNNVLKIALLNDQAYDANGDGDYTGPEDQTLQAVVSSLSYAIDNVNFTTLLPQIATSFTATTGLYAGNTVPLTENVSTFKSYSPSAEIRFNNDGIVNTEYISGLLGKVFPNGNFQDLTTGVTYGPDGNPI